MSNPIFELSYDHVNMLNQVVQRNGHKDLASFIEKDPRQGVAVLCLVLETQAGSKGKIGTVTTATSFTKTTDPALLKQLTSGLISDYEGKTVEVRLQKRRFGGYKTITVQIPAA